MTRQQRRQQERKLDNMKYREGYHDGMDYAMKKLQEAYALALEETKGIGDKRKVEIEQRVQEFLKTLPSSLVV